MKSVSVIDKLFATTEQSKMLKELLNGNGMEKTEKFKKQYIIPLLNKKNIEMPNVDEMIEQFKKINDYTMNFIKRWENGYIKKDLEKKFNYLNHQKILPNMTRLSSKIYDMEEEDKKILGNKYVELISKLTTFEIKCSDYLKNYIIPILETEKSITFDLSSTDENIKITTQKTLELFLKYIHELGSMTFHNSIFDGNSYEDVKELFDYYNFLYIDDIEVKKRIAKSLCSVFIENYKKIDLIKKSPSSNIKYLYLSTPYDWYIYL